MKDLVKTRLESNVQLGAGLAIGIGLGFMSVGFGLRWWMVPTAFVAGAVVDSIFLVLRRRYGDLQ